MFHLHWFFKFNDWQETRNQLSFPQLYLFTRPVIIKYGDLFDSICKWHRQPTTLRYEKFSWFLSQTVKLLNLNNLRFVFPLDTCVYLRFHYSGYKHFFFPFFCNCYYELEWYHSREYSQLTTAIITISTPLPTNYTCRQFHKLQRRFSRVYGIWTVVVLNIYAVQYSTVYTYIHLYIPTGVIYCCRWSKRLFYILKAEI